MAEANQTVNTIKAEGLNEEKGLEEIRKTYGDLADDLLDISEESRVQRERKNHELGDNTVTLEQSDFGSKYVEISGNALKLITETERKGHIYKKEVNVVRSFSPVKKIELDGESVFEVIAGRRIRGNVKEILEELGKNGSISNRAAAPDCVSSILTGLNIPTEKVTPPMGFIFWVTVWSFAQSHTPEATLTKQSKDS